MEDIRRHVFDNLGDCEVWVSVMPEGNIFEARPETTFTKENFDYFLYDPKSGNAGIRPAAGMHEHMYDAMDTLPNGHYTRELEEQGKIATYHFPVGLDEECQVLEWVHSITPEEYMRAYPDCISLIKEH